MLRILNKIDIVLKMIKGIIKIKGIESFITFVIKFWVIEGIYEIIFKIKIEKITKKESKKLYEDSAIKGIKEDIAYKHLTERFILENTLSTILCILFSSEL